MGRSKQRPYQFEWRKKGAGPALRDPPLRNYWLRGGRG